MDTMITQRLNDNALKTNLKVSRFNLFVNERKITKRYEHGISNFLKTKTTTLSPRFIVFENNSICGVANLNLDAYYPHLKDY